MNFRLFVFAVALSLMHNAAGQSAARDTTQTGVVLSKLSQPTYPQMARIAHITGDVQLKLGIRKDGSIESAVAVSGHPLLKEAALESAQQSLFECRGCGDEVTYYSLIYSFQYAIGPLSDVQVVQSLNHVTILAPGVRITLDNRAYIRVRSMKCLYLWRCGRR